MPLGIVSDEDFSEEVDKSKNPTETKILIVPKNHGGRNIGNRNVPDVLRKVIGEEAVEAGSTGEIAKTFGVSKSSVDAYKHGATSTASYDNRNNSLGQYIDRVTEKINTKAKDRLSAALERITDEKLENVKARDLASIAKDMSQIIEKTAPKGLNEGTTNILIYAPQRIKPEELGEAIDV